MPTNPGMRRVLASFGLVTVLALAGCGTTGSGTTGGSGDGVPSTTNPVTAPIHRAESVVGDLNERLRQDEQYLPAP